MPHGFHILARINWFSRFLLKNPLEAPQVVEFAQDATLEFMPVPQHPHRAELLPNVPSNLPSARWGQSSLSCHSRPCDKSHHAHTLRQVCLAGRERHPKGQTSLLSHLLHVKVFMALTYLAYKKILDIRGMLEKSNTAALHTFWRNRCYRSSCRVPTEELCRWNSSSMDGPPVSMEVSGLWENTTVLG